MGKFMMLPVATILMASGAAAHQTAPTTPPSVVAAAKPVTAEKPICRCEETTGSRFF